LIYLNSLAPSTCGFIALTRHSIREAEAAPVDRMRMVRQVWRGRR
jgi:hypothetical protein